MDYKHSGVDIEAGTETVRRIRRLARSTFTPAVLSDIGSFGGLFRFERSRYDDPVLVASADGVGTKLKVAFLANIHRTVGVDLVHHCVNDILVQGAEPLFFMDYLATGRLAPEIAAEIVEGMAVACRGNRCALLGGETAEMPGFYRDEEYDLAGFIVGVVDRAKIIDGSTLSGGDSLIGLASSGLHTNGYSLARRIVFDHLRLTVESMVSELGGSIGDALLEPHRSYLAPLAPLLDTGLIRGMAHITGGGITDNVPRMLPDGLSAEVHRTAWTVPPIFRFLQREGQVPDGDMWRTFNMGIGLVVACRTEDREEVTSRLAGAGETPVVIGELIPGERRVIYR